MVRDRPSPNRRLTEDEIKLVKELYAARASRAEIAARLGLPVWVLDVRRGDDLKDLPSRRGQGGGCYTRGKVTYDPKDIAARIREVQATWTEEERDFRLHRGPLPVSYQRLRPTQRWADSPPRGMIRERDLRDSSDPRYW